MKTFNLKFKDGSVKAYALPDDDSFSLEDFAEENDAVLTDEYPSDQERAIGSRIYIIPSNKILSASLGGEEDEFLISLVEQASRLGADIQSNEQGETEITVFSSVVEAFPEEIKERLKEFEA